MRTQHLIVHEAPQRVRGGRIFAGQSARLLQRRCRLLYYYILQYIYFMRTQQHT